MQSEGEYLVGVSFNPSQRPDVDEVKKLGAQLIDLLVPLRDSRGRGGREAAIAITEIEGGLMWAVKALTKPEKDRTPDQARQ